MSTTNNGYVEIENTLTGGEVGRMPEALGTHSQPGNAWRA